MLSFLMEWKGGVACHSLGETGSYCIAKIFGRLGAKGHFPLLKSPGSKRGLETDKISKPLDLGNVPKILRI